MLVILPKCANRLSMTYQVYNGKLSITTDAWTSPNHRAFVAICIHLENKGTALMMPLDLVEVDKVQIRLTGSSSFLIEIVVAHRRDPSKDPTGCSGSIWSRR